MVTSPVSAMAPVSTARRGAGRAIQGLSWVALYVVVTLTPLVVALTADPPAGRAFWVELSVGLGFVGLSLMGLQFAVVSRFSSVNAPFGLDVVLQYHRAISFVAMAFVLAHPAILMIREPALIELLNPLTAPWRARFGLVSVLALAALVATSLWRQRLRLSYEVWRVAHGLLAVVVVSAALVHIWQVGYYVSGPWKRTLWVLMSVALMALLVNIRVVKPLRLLRRPWQVESVRPEPGSTWVLTLAPTGHDGIRFMPGQFAWIRLGSGPFSVSEHPFSMSSSADDTGTIEFSIREAGDFTSTLGSVEPGTSAYVDGPYGVFSYERNEGPELVFVAGGVGISPILSMLRTMADRHDRRPCVLVYANSSAETIAHRETLRELASRLDLHVVHVIERSQSGDEEPEQSILADLDEAEVVETGLLDGGILDRHLPTGAVRARYFLCGPPAMMSVAESLLRERGVPAEHIDHERFDIM